MSRGNLGQAKQRDCMIFWLSGSTNSRYAWGPTQLDEPMASCYEAGSFGPVQDYVRAVQN